jgi:hypothetical protein
MIPAFVGVAGGLLALGTAVAPPHVANFGEGWFENSCEASVQQPLQQAIALLHSFEIRRSNSHLVAWPSK